MLKKHLSLGENKRNVMLIENTTHSRFTSVRSYKETASTLARVADNMGVHMLRDIDSTKASEYLNRRKDMLSEKAQLVHVQDRAANLVSQKTLDAERKALSILLNEPIARVYSSNDRPMGSRSYTTSQVDEIAKHQSPKNALATKVAGEAGLRASELLTLRKAGELNISSSRNWHDSRFVGMEGERYVVTGKGGLIREVMLSHETAKALEARRLNTPVTTQDRGVNFKSYYDIGGGNSFSQSYSAASKRALGFSNGAHGLRHQYAQARLEHIKSLGHSTMEAKLILSQEIGHFRASITDTYLR